MSTLKELLGELYTEDIAKKVGDKEMAVVNDGSWIPRDKFTAVSSEAKELKRQLAERDTQLEALKGKAAGNDDLLRQIDELKTENQRTSAEFAAKLAQQAKDFAVDKAISEAKGKNSRAIKALLDLDKVSLDGENILGLTEQIEALKTKDAYLFGDAQQPPLGGGTNPAGGGNKPPNINAEYEQAISSGNASLAIALKNKMFGITNKE